MLPGLALCSLALFWARVGPISPAGFFSCPSSASQVSVTGFRLIPFFPSLPAYPKLASESYSQGKEKRTNAGDFPAWFDCYK